MVQIENCDLVIVGSNSLRGLQALQRVDIINVKSLQIEPLGMAWDEDRRSNTDSRGIVVHIAQSSGVIVSDYSFRGKLENGYCIIGSSEELL
jgi:hypothetical protein